MGLAGNDDFAIKVSADGAAFTDAMVIDAASGAVQFPAGTLGSGSVAGVMGLQTVAFSCERNTAVTAGNYLAFGNGATQIAGVAMPFAGRVMAASLSQSGAPAGLNSVIITLNWVEATGYDVALTATNIDAESAVSDFSAAPLSFAAGDMVAMKVTASTASNSPTVGAFFVTFD